MTSGLTDPRAASHGLSGSRAAIGLLGLAAVALGIALLFDPVGAVDTLGLLLGLALLIGGLLEIAFAGEGPHRLRSIVLGTVLVVGGVAAAAWPDKTLTTLAVIIGVALIVHGGTRVGVAVVERHEIPGWGWFALAGGVNVVVGVLAIAWPDVTVRVLSLVIGFQALLFGLLLLLAAFLPGRGSQAAARGA